MKLLDAVRIQNLLDPPALKFRRYDDYAELEFFVKDNRLILNAYGQKFAFSKICRKNSNNDIDEISLSFSALEGTL
jgi:hypothetical protein